MNEMTNLVVKNDRAELAKVFGMWTSAKSTASDLVSWADSRIALYEKWIENLKQLKSENQMQLVSGLSIEDLQKMIAAKQQGNN